MAALNLRLSRVSIADMVDTRREHILRLRTGDEHLRILEGLRAELDAMHEGELASARIGELTARHAEFAATLTAALEMYRRDPLAEPADHAAAERIYEATVADRLGPTHSGKQRIQFSDEAARRRADLADDLARFPAPPGGRSVADLLDAWIAAGFAIGEALSAQSKDTDAGRTPTGAVRATEYAFARLRRSIRVELEVYEDLPVNLEKLILGYVDTLGRQRRRSGPAETVETVDGIDALDLDELPGEPSAAPSAVAPSAPAEPSDDALAEPSA